MSRDARASPQPLPKIAGKDGNTWVIVRFDHAGVTKMVKCGERDPFGEKYTQKWPATPYAVRVKNLAYPGPVEARCIVDGRLACTKILREFDDQERKNVRVLRGFQSRPKTVPYSRDSVVEFLFTLPRVTGGGGGGGGDQMKAPGLKVAQLETIRVEF